MAENWIKRAIFKKWWFGRRSLVVQLASNNWFKAVRFAHSGRAKARPLTKRYTATKIRMNQTDVERFMLEAIKEGRKALPACLPNPPVGCVLVRSGQVIARGHTNEPGGFHAEAMALNQVESNLDEVSAFVTLEPCSFHGRTPSCARSLISSGIKSIYVAIIDPHPKNNGEGIKILQDAGINVTLGVLAESAHAELEAYLCNAV